mmetsp:Transcript_2085/g.2887  ORF Transcript_2085/g.2887 Transcript_2085/m.2887 type:complete len:525 (+) Transcript_2085:20-1594(+)
MASFSRTKDTTTSNDDTPFSLPPAYDLHRSDRINGGEGSSTRPPSSFATTEDSIQSSSVADYQSTSSPGADEQYEGFRRVGGGEIGTSIGLAVPNVASSVSTFPANNYSAEQQDPSQLVQDIISHNSHYNGQNGSMDDPYYNSHEFESAARDATANIHNMHSKLLYLLSHPELFHEALSWEDQSLSAEANDKFEEDSTFEGLSDTNVKATQNETFEFNPNGDQGGGDTKQSKDENDTNNNSPPLPFDIFAADAEVVLPQALTATQLFGVERETGIELEAAAGITGLSHLFLRWLALMPEGDHMNVIRPPGLTVMRIAGGGYRVTAAHRVVWRWMNKFSFSPLGSSGETVDGAAAASAVDDTDFDFGDLVTMTIIDVFETDVDGRLLSYCPTFDNRAVHKTKETVERLKKGATQFKERMGVIAQSPAGKRVNKAAGHVGRIGMTAALRVGSMVKSKIDEIGTDEIKKRRTRGEEMDMEKMVQNEIMSNVGRDGEEGKSMKAVSTDRGQDYMSDDSASSPARRVEV